MIALPAIASMFPIPSQLIFLLTTDVCFSQVDAFRFSSAFEIFLSTDSTSTIRPIFFCSGLFVTVFLTFVVVFFFFVVEEYSCSFVKVFSMDLVCV